MLQLIYYTSCSALCITISIVCGVSYGLTFYKINQNNKNRKNRNEFKLAIAGFVLFLITLCCGILYGVYVMFHNVDIAILLHSFQQLLFDVYCCINAYLILLCSSSARQHFKAVVFRKPPESFATKTADAAVVARANVLRTRFRNTPL